jgi:hypothetical protein
LSRIATVTAAPQNENNSGFVSVTVTGLKDDLVLHAALRVLAGGDIKRLRLVREVGATTGRVIERYAAVPSLADPRALLPLDAAPAVLRAALGQHVAGAASPVARTAARLLRLASSLGLARLLLQERLSVVAPGDDLVETPLHDFLSEVLGQDEFVTSLRLAPRRPNGKPVVQVLARNGRVLAYAKFGWEKLTRRLICHEGSVLAELASLPRESVLQVPRIMYSGEWHNLETLVLVPLEGTGRTPRSPANVPVAASVALADVRPRVVERLGDSTFWWRTLSRIGKLAPLLSEGARHSIQEARHAIETRWGDVELPTGQIHGDWIPPNMLLKPDGKFNVWDWERSVSDAPLGIDPVQFILYLELQRRKPYRSLYSRVKRYGDEALVRHGLDPANLKLLVTLSLLETILWFGEARQAGRDEQEDSRFALALAAVLDQR